jgi:hypothetical protein
MFSFSLSVSVREPVFIIRRNSANKREKGREGKLIFMTRDKAADKRLSEDITTLSRENEREGKIY